jgi:hypothetical protein
MRWGAPEWIEVPMLVGLDVKTATEALSVCDLKLVVSQGTTDRDLDLIMGKLVIRQYPPAWENVPPGTAVTVWTDDDPDDEGVREPRWPSPPLRELQMERDEPFAGTE